MIPVPEGTFIARVRDGSIQLPPPMKLYCESAEWSLFRFEVKDANQMIMHPVMPDDPSADFHASLAPDGKLWIPALMRQEVALGEQSVMLRIENGAIGVYLRKVFDTLGFGPWF